MKDLFEETRHSVNYRHSTKAYFGRSIYRAIDDLKDQVDKYSTNSSELLDLLLVISEYKQIINKLSIVGLMNDDNWELLSEMLRKLDSRCRDLMDMNDETEEGE